MIDKTELQVGNTVIRDGYEFKILNGCDIDHHRIFEPIPFDEQRFESLGFKIKNKGKMSLYCDLKMYEIIDRNGRFYLYFNDDNQVLSSFKYLHQFQNIWYWISGQRLETK